MRLSRTRGSVGAAPDLPWVAMQAALVTAGVLLYFRVRGITESAPAGAVEHAHDIMALERSLGLDLEAGAQDVTSAWEPVITLANWVYIYGHWPVIAVVMVWLALRHRDRFVLLRDAMLVSGTIGVVIFARYPVAPPRLAGLGFTDTVTERSASYRLLQPPAFVNQYAAMPSLHAGWDLLVGLSVAAAAGYTWLRWIGRLLPVLMALSVVVTGNHFILDVVAGLTLAMFGHAVALGVQRLRDHASARRAASRRSRERSAVGAGCGPPGRRHDPDGRLTDKFAGDEYPDDDEPPDPPGRARVPEPSR